MIRIIVNMYSNTSRSLLIILRRLLGINVKQLIRNNFSCNTFEAESLEAGQFPEVDDGLLGDDFVVPDPQHL